MFGLEAKAADGNKLPSKWDPKATRVSIHLGHSPAHASSVALVFNPRTLRVSPQFHVVFDDNLSTLPYKQKSEMHLNRTNLVKLSCKKDADNDFELATRLAEELDPVDDMDVDEEPSGEPGVQLPSLEKGEFLATSRDGLVSNFLPDGASEARENVRASGARPGIHESMVDVKSMVVPDTSVPALADSNDLSCRNSCHTSKPSLRVKESSDKFIKRMFSLACLFPMVCYYVVMAFIAHAQSMPSCVQIAVYHVERLNTTLFDSSINSLHHAYLTPVWMAPIP